MLTIINIVLIVFRHLLFSLRSDRVKEYDLIRIFKDRVDMEKLFDCKLTPDSDLITGIFLLLEVKMSFS